MQEEPEVAESNLRFLLHLLSVSTLTGVKPNLREEIEDCGVNCLLALFGGGNGFFAELLEELFDFKRDFACASAGGLVAVFYLSLGVLCKCFEIRCELFNDSFHRLGGLNYE